MIFLEELGLLYEFQKPIKRYIADFFLPDYNLIIEADGDYWHNRPGAKVYDALKDLIYRGLGIKVVRLTEALINGDTDVCLELIREGCLG
jgi:very-short-patch-repair endonuclease